MTIRDLQYAIQMAIDESGIPDDAEVRVERNPEGGADIRAEYGCGFYRLGAGVPIMWEDAEKAALLACIRATRYYLEGHGVIEDNYATIGEDRPSVLLHKRVKGVLAEVGGGK